MWGEEDRSEQGGNEKGDIWGKEQIINKQNKTHPYHNRHPQLLFLGVSEALTLRSLPMLF